MKSLKVVEITESDLWAAVDAARGEAGMEDGEIPPGGFTTAQYAQRYKLSHRRADLQLTRLFTDGTLNRVKMRIKCDRDRRAVWVYFPATQKARKGRAI